MEAHPSWKSVHRRVLKIRLACVTVEKVTTWLSNDPVLSTQVFTNHLDFTNVPTVRPGLPPLRNEGAAVNCTVTL